MAKKKELKPVQASAIAEKFPQYTYDWLMGNENKTELNETAQYKVKGGELDNLAVMVNENWEGLLKHPLLVPKFESEIYKKAFDLVMEKMKG